LPVEAQHNLTNLIILKWTPINHELAWDAHKQA